MGDSAHTSAVKSLGKNSSAFSPYPEKNGSEKKIKRKYFNTIRL
jgi:hypothetical protein